MKILVLLIAFISISWLGKAQSTLRLPEAVNIALKNSLDIQLAKNKISTDSINNNIGLIKGDINPMTQLVNVKDLIANESKVAN